jgi:hypothetical protein
VSLLAMAEEQHAGVGQGDGQRHTWVGPLGLGEEGVSQVWEGGGLLKIYEVVYKIMLGLVLDSISPILRVQDPFREHCCR